MSRFTVLLLALALALALAFVSGWLFSNEVPAPAFDNVALAMWIACGGVAVIASLMVSARG